MDDLIKKNGPKESRIEGRLRRIANVLLLNASFTDNLGLLNGKMGIAIFFYHYSRYSGNKIFGDYAGELIDEIYEEINTNTPVDFANGLTGIGWGIEYLVKNGFVQADTDEALTDIDNSVYRIRLQSPILINNCNDFFCYGHYYISRICGHIIDDNDLNTLIKKYHLIFMTDECERILLQKQFTRFETKSLSIDTIISLFWFLLEIDRLKIFPVKVKNILNCIPEYINEVINNSDDYAGLRQLYRITKKAGETVSDKVLRNIFKELSNKLNIGLTIDGLNKETSTNYFIKETWQKLIYNSYYSEEPGIELSFKRMLENIEDDNNLSDRLNKLNKDSLGLTGLAGLGLGFLRAQSKSSEKITHLIES